MHCPILFEVIVYRTQPTALNLTACCLAQPSFLSVLHTNQKMTVWSTQTSQPDPGIETEKQNAMGGHLFQGRCKAILCDRDAYLLELVRYIHLNPARLKNP